MNEIAVARALHVLAVVIWIGGVSMVTTVVLPALRRGALGGDRHRAFEEIERRFVWIARGSVLLAGATGLYMIARLGLWASFKDAHFWWMHAMLCLWLLFSLMLFVVEPLIVRRQRKKAGVPPPRALKFAQRGHWLLLLLSIVTVLGAVAGSQGWAIF